MKKLQHTMHFVDKLIPAIGFDVVASIEAADRAETHHLVECLILFAEKLSGETFQRVKNNASSLLV